MIDSDETKLLKLQLEQGFLITSNGERPIKIGERPLRIGEAGASRMLNDIEQASDDPAGLTME